MPFLPAKPGTIFGSPLDDGEVRKSKIDEARGRILLANSPSTASDNEA